MNKSVAVIMLSLMFIFAFACSVQAQQTSTQDTLKQYVADLQKNPSDNTLRKQIIDFVKTMNPPAAIPEEAHRHLVMAEEFRKKAKDASGYGFAIDEYKQALLLVPWLSDAYNNLAVLCKLAGRYDEAIVAWQQYLLANPPDARDAQDMIYKTEAEKGLAAEEATNKKAAEEKAKLESFEGTWDALVNFQGELRRLPNWMKIYRSQGGEWIVDPIYHQGFVFIADVTQHGRNISFTMKVIQNPDELNTDYFILSLSSDGTKLVGTRRSMSIGGGSPHWVTDEAQFIRQ